MKNAYRVVLIGLAVVGVVYAVTKPEEMNKEVKYEYEPVEICTFPVSMEVGHFVQLEKCGDYKIKLEQVPCGDIGRNATTDFPCYEGCVTIKVRANYPAIFSASVNKSGGDVDILNEMNLYWENGVNTIKGTGGWEKMKLCLEAWDVDLYKSTPGTAKVHEITICVRPKDTQLED